MNRRTFLGWVGVGWLASSLPIAIAACSNQTKTETSGTPTPPHPPNNDGFKVIGTVSQLDQKGKILNKQFSSHGVLVVRHPDDPNRLSAVNPICTHKGCTVDWKKDSKVFDCPCHHAKFTADGKIVKGPAKEPLATYEVKIAGDSILVKEKQS